ncbi:MAG: AMP-binding protein, partial [Planctomycetota bacterium]
MTDSNGTMIIQERFENTVKQHAERIALWDPNKPWNYSYLDALSKMGASGLLMLNPSPHVGILLPAIREFAMVYLAVLRAGRVPVPMNFLLGRDELKFIIGDAGIDTIITSTMFRDAVGGAAPNIVYLEELDFTAGAMLAPPPPPDAKPDDLATILYTSGTTGRPKGV